MLHGNAVRVDDGCAVVLGRSGAGKSTLSAEFVRRDLDLLADDVVPVDDLLRALPGTPRIKLWADAADRRGSMCATCAGSAPRRRSTTCRCGADRWGRCPCAGSTCSRAARGLGSGSRQPRAGAFDMLWRHTYRPGLFQGSAPARHLERCHHLQEQVRLVRCFVPSKR